MNDPQRGTVLGLAGNSAWVSAGTLPVLSLDSKFSWSFWARQAPGQSLTSGDILLGNRYGADGADTDPREFIKFTPDRFEFHVNATGDNDLQYGSTDIPSSDVWMHHAVVKQAATLTYLRNGEVINTGRVTRDMLSADPLPFAMGGQNGQETWKGYLSDVRLFDHALTSGEIGDLSGTGLKGDYNRNGSLDAADLDLQAAAIVSGANPATFDLNSDSQVNLADRLVWVNTLKKTWIGDADLNGVFNTSDFVTVFQEGGYEAGPRAATQAVPEPSTGLLLGLGLLLFARRTTVHPARTAVRSVA